MKVIKPEGLKEIKGSGPGNCICSEGSANARIEGFVHYDCGSQCSYGSDNKEANYYKAHNIGRPLFPW